MKQQTSFVIKNSNPKHKKMSYFFTTLLLIVCWCFVSTHKLYGQKNEFGLVYNFTGYNYDEMSDFGFRYARYINPRVSASFSFDNQKNCSISGYETGSNFYTLFQELYKNNISIANFDFCVHYNCLKPGNRLSLNPFLGICNQLYMVNYIPLAEMRDNVIYYYKGVRDDRSLFLMPKFGLNVSYRIYSLLKIGVELFYKSLPNATDKRIFIEKTNAYNNQGLYASNTKTYDVPNQFGISFSLLVQF
jgi:hypothetical protein